MAEGKKSIIIYTSWKIWLDAMTLEQKGAWLDWIMSYTNDENPTNPSDPVVNMGCMIAKEQLKRDLIKYEAKVESVKQAREKRKAENEINMKSECNHTEINSDNVNDNVNVNVNVNVNDNVLSNDNNNINKPSAKACKHKFGKYGRVLLTDEEHSKLIAEFGESKINAQIELLDEYIESNGNKNKYKNFNLVLRKSIRENWFKQSGANTNNGFTSLVDTKIEWEAL